MGLCTKYMNYWFVPSWLLSTDPYDTVNDEGSQRITPANYWTTGDLQLNFQLNFVFKTYPPTISSPCHKQICTLL